MRTIRVSLAQYPLLAVLVVGAATTSASAQSRDLAATSTSAVSPAPPSRAATVRGPAELVCLERLDAGATLHIVEMLVERDAAIRADARTNCLIVVGASNLAPVRQLLAELERRADGATARAPSPRPAGADARVPRPRR